MANDVPNISAAQELQKLKDDINPKNGATADRFLNDLQDLRNNPTLLKSVLDASSGTSDVTSQGFPAVSLDSSGGLHVSVASDKGSIEFIQQPASARDPDSSLNAITRDGSGRIVSEQPVGSVYKLQSEDFKYDSNGLKQFTDIDGQTWKRQSDGKFIDQENPKGGEFSVSLDNQTGTLSIEQGTPGSQSYTSYARQANGSVSETLSQNGQSVEISGRDEGHLSGADSKIYSEQFSNGDVRTFNYAGIDGSTDLKSISDSTGQTWTADNTGINWNSTDGGKFTGLIATDMQAGGTVYITPNTLADGTDNRGGLISSGKSLDVTAQSSAPLPVTDAANELVPSAH